MFAKALTVDGGGKVVAMACGTCGMVHSPLLYAVKGEPAMAAARQAAEACCEPYRCRDCGTETERYRLVCDRCRGAEIDAREAATYAAATVVEWDEDAGEMLYDPHGDRFVSDLWEIEEDENPPPYAYATRGQALHISAESVVEAALESGEHYEDARYSIGDDAMADLQAYLDGWCKRVNIISWFPDYSRVVVFDRATAP